ncbi:glycosyltransferase [Streptomyces sp. NPDC127098]|uniref:glycosyltransferase n=1 Tax=Streptomyces sp. NPDC127098 TaxID=3347137 RepID=UPI0036558D66
MTGPTAAEPIHVVECHFEFGGFDHRFVKGGISVYLWNLSRALRARGLRVSGLTAAHGTLPELRRHHHVTDLDHADTVDVEVPLDPAVWPDHGPAARLTAEVTAHRITVDGIDVVLLAGGLLDAHPETFYPPYESKGRDLGFLKPLLFQLAATRYLAGTVRAGTVVHLHEPYYHYLMPAPLRRAGAETVCTVQSNMPVNKKVYGPEVRALLRYLGASEAPVAGLQDPPLDSPLERAMRAYLPVTHLYNEYPERPGHDYVSGLALVARTASALDFLSPGQLEHVTTQRDTPAQALFGRLRVREELAAARDRLVVGGCAVGPAWLAADRARVDRDAVLRRRGLDPARPTIYHNARYAIHHKGQRELARALRRLLDDGRRFNAVLHCLSPLPPTDPELTGLAAAHPDAVWLCTEPIPEAELIELACSAELCLFPSKFEMDTFLLAMGEAMACGAVPVATAQLGMAHFGHTRPPDHPEATGAALPRSFRADDPALTAAIRADVDRLLAAPPEELARLRANAIHTARAFTWERVAATFHAVFTGVRAGTLTPHRPGPAPVPPAPGTGTVRPAGAAGWHVAYRAPGARTVDVVRGTTTSPLMADADGTFTGTVPAATEPAVVLLITRADGRVGWEVLDAPGAARDEERDAT